MHPAVPLLALAVCTVAGAWAVFVYLPRAAAARYRRRNHDGGHRG